MEACQYNPGKNVYEPKKEHYGQITTVLYTVGYSQWGSFDLTSNPKRDETERIN